ncbi:hypothetical protein FXO38_36544 [Capsicum annuum]|nr:hypothetical protein FXO37_36600 [Capsicum annuum]KAF3612917.1 hypothetical protein FXO38_36544 [Capsicum annuum]
MRKPRYFPKVSLAWIFRWEAMLLTVRLEQFLEKRIFNLVLLILCPENELKFFKRPMGRKLFRETTLGLGDQTKIGMQRYSKTQINHHPLTMPYGAAAEFTHLSRSSTISQSLTTSLLLNWKPPPQCRFKLYSDGETGGIRGVIRNSRGD